MDKTNETISVADSLLDRIRGGLNPGHEAALVKGDDPEIVYEAELKTRIQVMSLYREEGVISDKQIEEIISVLKERYSNHLDHLRELLKADRQLSSFAYEVNEG